MARTILFIFVISFCLEAFAGYPQSWWKYIPREDASSWEILPQDANAGEVVLSKRTELGVFSNLAYSPFYYAGENYNSIEGFWQMMKYPEGVDDRRFEFGYGLTRDHVAKLWGFDAKNAGKLANKIMREHEFSSISYRGHFFDYKDYSLGSEKHYRLIFEATKAKIEQNEHLRILLRKTKGLILVPDHRQGNKPKSYYYHEILMKIRDRLI